MPSRVIRVGSLTGAIPGVGFSNHGELTMKRTSLKKLCCDAFKKQGGRCYYCDLPMWKENSQEFAERHGLTFRQSRLLQATGEHLIPYSLGGPATNKNIVAACFHCNQTRHKYGGNPTVEAYMHRVHARMNLGKWYPFDVCISDCFSN